MHDATQIFMNGKSGDFGDALQIQSLELQNLQKTLNQQNDLEVIQDKNEPQSVSRNSENDTQRRADAPDADLVESDPNS